ncbi:hypothetical protein CDAR_42151 [Caerostris darwini]|uniref:Uncharacterized protein n=1 Tax=Caerostris darwini TaxID=1538125 RepID=A0AAV4RHW9_9ARAC|nr:hypothetical protein CDAR_42151 [Caerostris darwini]
MAYLYGASSNRLQRRQHLLLADLQSATPVRCPVEATFGTTGFTPAMQKQCSGTNVWAEIPLVVRLTCPYTWRNYDCYDIDILDPVRA